MSSDTPTFVSGAAAAATSGAAASASSTAPATTPAIFTLAHGALGGRAGPQGG